MSAFSARWLALREPADCRSRARPLERGLARWAWDRTGGGARPLRIVDLGCGTGANMRRLAPSFAVPQAWRLVDQDPALLAMANDRAMALSRQYPRIQGSVTELDLAATDLSALVDGADLVTASALFDLVSAGWCERLITACERPGGALFATLIYNGEVTIEPGDPFDRDVLELFNAHQFSDKGFGPALGCTAVNTLARLMAATGARLAIHESNWFMGPIDAALQEELLGGLADAAASMAPDRAEAIGEWRARRLAAVAAGRPFVTVGHRDILALWPPALNNC